MEGPGGIAPDEEIPLRRGIVAPAVAEEFPELSLLWTVVERGSGRTPRSVRDRLDTLSNKIREKVTKGKDKVSDAQIAAYYNKNKQRFAQPERRDLRIVLTKDKAKAEQARKALESGQSFKTVAKKY